MSICSTEDQSEQLLGLECGRNDVKAPVKPTHQRFTSSSTALWLLTVLLVFCLGVSVGYQMSIMSDKSRMFKDQNWSLDFANSSRHQVLFNGSFRHRNIYRHDPGPEVDAAWESLGINYNFLAVPTERAADMGLSSHQVQISNKYGGGFPAQIEGLHHLHCLNLLRQSLWFNYAYYHSLGVGAFAKEESWLKLHVTHCLDILRQQMMCQPDEGVLGMVWFDQQMPKAFPDYNTRHMCKNFEKVRASAKTRQLSRMEEWPKDFLRPPEERDVRHDEIP